MSGGAFEAPERRARACAAPALTAARSREIERNMGHLGRPPPAATAVAKVALTAAAAAEMAAMTAAVPAVVTAATVVTFL